MKVTNQQAMKATLCVNGSHILCLDEMQLWYYDQEVEPGDTRPPVEYLQADPGIGGGFLRITIWQ